MDIITFFTPAEFAGLDSSADVVIVFDVLRGTTTITAALRAGAAKIYPIGQIDEASPIMQTLGGDHIMLCGSLNGEPIENFHLGSSPLEFLPEKVGGKTIIYYSINMANAVKTSARAQRILLGCFNNMQAIIDSVEYPSQIHLLCAGKMGRFSFEDAVCAGMFIQRLVDGYSGEVGLNDASVTSRYLYYRHHRDIPGMLIQSAQGHYLKQTNHEADLDYAGQIDTVNIVPELSLDKTHIIPTVALGEAL
jgi:2-phosphosulfolactate phosphatase